jgi:acetolactate synthase-1/3 small subunit
MTLELIGVPEKIDSFIEMVKEYGIIDISRTGVTAMQRG